MEKQLLIILKLWKFLLFKLLDKQQTEEHLLQKEKTCQTFQLEQG